MAQRSCAGCKKKGEKTEFIRLCMKGDKLIIDENHSELIVDINVSPQFFGWIFSLGNDVEIVSPREVVNELREYTKKFIMKYE